jgi:CheY-like chemotaxis protein
VKICWADDDANVAATLASSLEGLQAQITFVSSAEGALDALAAHPFDVLLVDLQMPPGKWGGLWLLEQLRDMVNPPPALVLSGQGSQQETIKALRLGAVDYVEKYKSRDELADRIVATAEGGLARIVDGAESQTVEFKQSIKHDASTGGANRALGQAVLRTIAAFANTDGGTLVVGRHDNGELIGIHDDLQLMQSPDIDAFERHVRDLISSWLGIATNRLVRLSFPQLRGAQLARLDVSPSSAPLYMRDKSGEIFYIRAGNLTRRLVGSELESYLGQHWAT